MYFTKQIQLYSVPPIFIISFQRIRTFPNGSKKKIYSQIDFPINNFDLSSIVIKNNFPNDFLTTNYQQRNMIYNLVGIINHHGSLTNSGHYTSYCKRNKKWYNFDDTTVTLIEEQNLITNKAYVLIYQSTESL